MAGWRLIPHTPQHRHTFSYFQRAYGGDRGRGDKYVVCKLIPAFTSSPFFSSLLILLALSSHTVDLWGSEELPVPLGPEPHSFWTTAKQSALRCWLLFDYSCKSVWQTYASPYSVSSVGGALVSVQGQRKNEWRRDRESVGTAKWSNVIIRQR